MGKAARDKGGPRRPGYDGGRLVPGQATVESPYGGTREAVPANMAENPTLAMYNTRRRGKRLVDEAQLRAATEIHRLWRQMHGKSAGVIDPSNEPVDVSKAGKDWTPKQQEASRRLIALRADLGRKPWALVMKVAGEEVAPRQLTATLLAKKVPTEADHKYVSRLYRDSLKEAAVHFGFATGG